VKILQRLVCESWPGLPVKILQKLVGESLAGLPVKILNGIVDESCEDVISFFSVQAVQRNFL